MWNMTSGRGAKPSPIEEAPVQNLAMVAINTNSQFQASKTASGDVITAQSEERAPTRTSPSAPRKLLTMMSGLMDLMVEGLAPGVIKQRRAYELIVVGAGTAGTTAAICAASEGIDTLIIEAGQAEGGAQFIECIDNCAANPRGITMGSRADLSRGQGRRFLLDMRPGLAVTGIRAEDGYWQVETNQGHWLEARSVILAPGSRRRRLNVPGEETLAGAGVHTCANCEGPVYAGKDLLVIGAGNSGIEQALYLATFAKSVTVVEQSARARCSRELYRKAKAHPNITFKFNRTVREFKGSRLLRSVLVEDVKSGDFEELYAAAAFIAIGLEPATSAFQASVDVDQSGFIKTNRSMQTKLPGVFAAGHARSPNVESSEDAASEGYKAAMLVRKYLAKAKR